LATHLVNDTTIQSALAPLIGQPLRCIGRAADLLWIQFGKYCELPDRNGSTRTVGEWALHVQCPWRIARPPSIIIGQGDLHYAAEGIEPYDWDADGESRFDRLAKPLNLQFEGAPPRVSSVVTDVVGGFTLCLDDGCTLDVFPADSTDSDTEQWRIFRPGAGESHFVFPSA
jgi:hypothetical protein